LELLEAVNLADTNIPVAWEVEKHQSVKWSVRLGNRSHGSPVVAGGKVFVGTNNDVPRDPRVKGPRAVLMCFREVDGKFLWQIVQKMPADEIVREASNEGLCSVPTVERDRLYYVTPGCKVVCASTAGKILWFVDLMATLKVYPCYLNTCSP